MRAPSCLALLSLLAFVSGCVSPADPKFADPDPTDVGDKAIANCVERVRRSTTPSSMNALRQVLRVRTDEEAYPALCRKIRRGVAAGRLTPNDLWWDDGAHPMSKNLVKVLRES